MSRRVVIGILIAMAVVVGAGGVLYAFGTPTKGAVAVAPASTTLGAPQAPASLGQDAEVPEPDPSSPLAIEIPGCRCHSDDPKLVKEHEAYRMNQCAGCHAGRVPTGQ
jgi:hypothetical protein